MHDVREGDAKRTQVSTELLHHWTGYTLLSDVGSMHKVAGWWSGGCCAKWPPIGGLIHQHAGMVIGDNSSDPKHAQSESGNLGSQGRVSQE